MPDPSPSTRREFLKGRAAVRSLDAAIKTSQPLLPPQLPGNDGQPLLTDGSRQSSYLEHYSKPAMACQFEFLFNMQQYGQSGNASGDAFALIDELEDQMTVYRDHSTISQLNQRAFESPEVVEDRLFDLLLQAREIWQETGGAFDATAGQLSSLWGFEQRQGEIPDQAAIDETLQVVGTQHLRFDEQASSISFAKSGLKINLGGIGKGYAIDRVASLFRINGIHDFAIHGGQSSVMCGGNYTSEDAQTQPSNGGWPIGLTHPVLPEVRLAHFNLKDRALGTSGSGRQGFFHQGKRYGHVIDPRTGWPTDHFLSTTVISPSAALSDALATAFFVMDEEAVEAYCQQHTEVSAVLIKGDPQGGKSAVDLLWFNLTDEDWEQHT